MFFHTTLQVDKYMLNPDAVRCKPLNLHESAYEISHLEC
jgi:hypothetical protein